MDAKGSHIKTISFSLPSSSLRLLAFNSQNDLVLLAEDGHLQLLDIWSEKITAEHRFTQFADKVTHVEEARFDPYLLLTETTQEPSDCLALRTRAQ